LEIGEQLAEENGGTVKYGARFFRWETNEEPRCAEDRRHGKKATHQISQGENQREDPGGGSEKAGVSGDNLSVFSSSIVKKKINE